MGVDVTTCADAGLLGADDTEHIAFALAEGRVIYTQDDDFLAIAASGVKHAGVAYCKQNSRSIGQVIRGLALLRDVYESHEMRDRVEFL